jgi:hypothetical protein
MGFGRESTRNCLRNTNQVRSAFQHHKGAIRFDQCFDHGSAVGVLYFSGELLSHVREYLFSLQACACNFASRFHLVSLIRKPGDSPSGVFGLKLTTTRLGV